MKRTWQPKRKPRQRKLGFRARMATAGGRAIINTSPEPFSNWSASFSEDAMVVAGIWFAFHYPVAFLCTLALFVLLLIWLLPKLWRGVAMMLHRVRAAI